MRRDPTRGSHELLEPKQHHGSPKPKQPQGLPKPKQPHVIARGD